MSEMRYVDLGVDFEKIANFHDLQASFAAQSARCEIDAHGDARVTLPLLTDESLLFEKVVTKVATLARRRMDEREKGVCIAVIDKMIEFSQGLDQEYLLKYKGCWPRCCLCSQYYPSNLARRRVQLVKESQGERI